MVVCLTWDTDLGGRARCSPKLRRSQKTPAVLISLVGFIPPARRKPVILQGRVCLSAYTDFPYVGNTTGVAWLRESRTPVQYEELTSWRQRGGSGNPTPLPTGRARQL
jgi:hypothetical protein